jgi:hypothetical protein
MAVFIFWGVPLSEMLRKINLTGLVLSLEIAPRPFLRFPPSFSIQTLDGSNFESDRRYCLLSQLSAARQYPLCFTSFVTTQKNLTQEGIEGEKILKSVPLILLDFLAGVGRLGKARSMAIDFQARKISIYAH